MKYALISGSESGLALAVLDNLKKLDYTIFCCDLKYCENKVIDNIHYLKLDATNNDNINEVYDYISNITNKLDLISNFAGIVTLGSLVELDMDSLSKILNINLISTYKLNAKFFPLLKEARGRIINISSEYAKICAIPFHGYYGISKHAFEVYNDSLRRELLGSGVKVVCMRPGAFKTNMQEGVMAQFGRMVDETNLYKTPLMKMKHIMSGELVKAKDPYIFAKAYMKALLAKNPRRYYNVKNSFKMKLLSILPIWLQDFAFKIYLK